MVLAQIARRYGHPINLSPGEARFGGRPHVVVRHRCGVVESYFDNTEGRGGGVDALARLLRLPLDPPEYRARYARRAYG